MVDKYKNTPYSIKTELIERYAKKMYGSGWEQKYGRDGRTIDELLDEAVYGLSKTVKKNVIGNILKVLIIPNEYFQLKNSGMMWEFFPKYTGLLADDMKEFSKFVMARETNKGWIDLVLNPD